MIEVSLFDFVDKFAAEPQASSPGADIASNSVFTTFCESLFDQFFASRGWAITGFSASAKRDVLVFRAQLPPDDTPELTAVRKIVVRFEEFCDKAADMKGNYSGSGVSYASARELLRKLLANVQDLAGSLDHLELVTRISDARSTLEGQT